MNENFTGTSNDNTFSYSYSNAHETQTVAASNGAFFWQPPPISNSTSYTPNNLNQYAAIGSQTTGGTNCSGAAQGLSYDCNGNLTFDGTFTYTYDAENRLLTANKTAGGTIAATYLYDPLGRRTKKSGTGVTTTYFLNDGTDEVAEYDSTKTITKRIVPGPDIDEPVAIVDMTTGTKPKEYFHTDRQGSVVAMSDASGNLVEGPYTYDAYGNCFSGVSSCGTAGEPYRFTGRRYDPETGLYYYRARYYDPQKGRFLQTDPVRYDADLNFYTYVGNDPADRNDPNGLASEANGGSDSDCAGTDSNVTHCYAGPQYQGGQGETTKSGNAGEGSIAASAEFLAATAACKNCATGASKAQTDDNSNAQVVQRAVITALKILNPKQDEIKNIQPYTDNFAKAVNPKAINTQSWTEQYSLHASAIESPPIPGFSSYAVKLYNDPKLGNVIAVVYPTNSVWHYVYVIPYEMGYPVNAKIGREFLNQQSGGW